VLVSATNFYFRIEENNILYPLNKAYKRGASGADWKKAYQAVKHERVRNLDKGNIKHLIRSLGALYLLNVYYRDLIFELEKNSTGTNFDYSLGSKIFSIILHIESGVNQEGTYRKLPNFNECVYLLRQTEETKTIVQESIRKMNEQIGIKTRTQISKEITKIASSTTQLNIKDVLKNLCEITDEIETSSMKSVLSRNPVEFINTFKMLRYEAILNKQQY
jgi:hypothetical protein